MFNGKLYPCSGMAWIDKPHHDISNELEGGGNDEHHVELRRFEISKTIHEASGRTHLLDTI